MKWPILLGCATLIIFCILVLRSIRKREEKEVARFESMPKTPDDTFLQILGGQLEEEEKDIALRLRNHLAGLGKIPPESLTPDTRLSELDHLPFYNSPDVTVLIIELEEILEEGLSESRLENMFPNDIFLPHSTFTIGQYIDTVVDYYRKKKAKT